jgi:hypothetical protein
MKVKNRINSEVFKLLHEGTVIPAHPLALDSTRRLDERRQRALTRYYMDAGFVTDGQSVDSSAIIRVPG